MRTFWWNLAAAALLAAGCAQRAADTAEPPSGGAAGGAKRLTVGFSQIGAESGWRTAETESIREEAAKRGIELKFSDAQQKQENQIKALRSFIAQKVDAILLAPVVETGWDAVLQEAKDAGIPVVLVDRGVKVRDDSLYATLIASDFVAEGRMAGEWLAERTKDRPEHVIGIAELQGTPGAAPAIDRKRGFEQGIAKNPKLRIVLSQSGDFTRAKGKQAMEAFLKSGQKFGAVFAHNDDMALGAIQAIEEAGLKPGKDLLIVSVDGVRDALQALIDGKLNLSVECNPLLGPLAFDAVEAAVAGKPLPKWTVVKDRAFDREAAMREIAGRRY
ncbi:MAG: ABC transporter substrate-binding protein [Fimbriimonadales bacterium]|nr:ABC transporter substrate-binding protein [Fimbriimonadales bacterium]